MKESDKAVLIKVLILLGVFLGILAFLWYGPIEMFHK